MKEKTNKEPMICAMRGRSDGEWHESEHEQRIECREDGVTNTITGVSKDNMVAEPTQEVLGWTRSNKDWRNIQRHPVEVANCVTAGKRDNTQNYVKEQIPLNTDQEGLAITVTTAHHYSGNIVDPKRGQKEMGVLEKFHQQDFVQHEDGVSRCLVAGSHGNAAHYTKTAVSVKEMGFRVRRLTERELFRLMDLSEEDIDKIQAAGISKTQQAKMAGNSICVNVLYEIFRKLFVDTERETAQLELF